MVDGTTKITLHADYFRPCNRGNKLRAALDAYCSPTRPTLWPSHDEETEFMNIGKRRAIVRRRYQRSQYQGEEDPYADIQIQDIWQLPEKYEDLLHIEPIKDTFKSRHLQLLSEELMQIIEQYASFYRNILQLGRILLNDDPDKFDLFKTMDPADLIKCLQATEELTALINEYMERLSDIRRKLIKSYLQKKQLAIKLNI
ncbi:hypothetical protein BC833DRAFT_531780 [Globomyces pollinis-pini]|nr:hypothetical protein BC833DRAFT_531780 [Globomyces pollinis-pini]